MLVYCGQTVGWIKMPLRTEVGLGPGDIPLDGDPVPIPRKGAQQPPTFRPMSIVAKRSPISATAELLLSLMCCQCLPINCYWPRRQSVGHQAKLLIARLSLVPSYSRSLE